MEDQNILQSAIIRKGKRDIIYCRMDKVMLNELFQLREETGISTSELVREAVRRLLEDAKVIKVNLSV